MGNKKVSKGIRGLTLKKSVTIFVVLVLAAGSIFYFLYMAPRRVTPILMYHSIGTEQGDSLSVNPSNFERQMDFIKKSGYKVITLDQLVESINAGRTYLPKTVVITFDDGFEDNYISAFPILSKYGMPATMFLVTGYIGREKGYLTWDQVQVMAKNGIDFGGHTRGNVYLPSVEDSGILWEEVSGCKKDIESHTGGEVRYFCYPTGAFTEKVKDSVKLAGYRGACTTHRGKDRSNKDVFALNRVKITNSDMNKPFHFRGKLSGFYNCFRRAR